MDHLSTPWRMQYINGNQSKPEDQACVFCAAAKMEDSFDNLIVKRCENTFIILNRFPYNNAHLLIVPFVHVACIEHLSPTVRHEIMDMANLSVETLKSLYAPQGFNLGFNLGAVAGAGIAEHLHMHVIPRWGGDTNFMSTVGQTRVLPEELTETYQRLYKAFNS
jgi:ATP adenylyltransferase